MRRYARLRASSSSMLLGQSALSKRDSYCLDRPSQERADRGAVESITYQSKRDLRRAFRMGS